MTARIKAILDVVTERPTSEVAAIVGVNSDVLRKWIHRGHLKLCPHSLAGPGAGNQMQWTDEAIAEAVAWKALRRQGRKI